MARSQVPLGTKEPYSVLLVRPGSSLSLEAHIMGLPSPYSQPLPLTSLTTQLPTPTPKFHLHLGPSGLASGLS